ncbi:MAG TPA: PIG-L deacetylase family protein [Steroidobacteraceae bacterium]|nr:PIG-L deacetylase family protein [Steroidobacteraceae bacterium]
MLRLIPDKRGALEVLCIGAHSDDVEIGCGGTLLELLDRKTPVNVTWVVLSGIGAREQEARASAGRFLAKARRRSILVEKFRDGYFPTQHSELKDYFETLKGQVSPDIIFTHVRDDLHQDHRTVAELTWNTFRNHLVLEYEIVKYDGGLGSPNAFMPVSPVNCRRKARLLMRGFATQRSKRWFTEDTFMAMLRIRGIECNAPSGHAEGFYVRKVVL